ncbi:MAG: glycosyltransferase [Proteobacteria bacterium]|nr:glycosyltransferase [Pseudomonadota bacterium]MDA0927244.1 glycosyltransferase [Pseudomonadota bacterium]
MPTDTAPGQPSLVSVICRTIGRSELEQAVNSVAAQTYLPIELVVVDAANSGMDSVPGNSGQLSLKIVNTGTALPRADAANAGMKAASGDYFMFLDDDDWIAPKHIAGLMDALQSDTSARAAYSNTQRTDPDGSNPDYVFEQDYDPIMLLRDNYVPIHAMLFERSLFDEGCRFDNRFDIFEDWDFWIQVSQLTPFRHIHEVTAFYRGGGDSETSADDVNVRYDNDSVMGKARIKVFNKWLGKWTGEQVNSMLASLDQGSVVPGLHAQLKELDARLNAEHDTNLRHQQQIQQQAAAQETLQHEYNVAKGTVEDLQIKLTDREGRIGELEQHATHLERDKQLLQQHLEQLRNSFSWKITAPLRYLRRLFVNSDTKQGNSSE